MRTQTVKIIFDCDNSMGLPGKDIDDGLALLYLLGCGRVELAGITTTFGNASQQAVHANTAAMLARLGLGDLSLIAGAAGPVYSPRGAKDANGANKAGTPNPAAAFIARCAAARAGELKLLATGAPTNIAAACRLQPGLPERVSELVLMGGVTAPLDINGRTLAELNFSCDPAAAGELLGRGGNISVITGNVCLSALFAERQLRRVLRAGRHPVFAYMRKSLLPWYAACTQKYGVPGFYAWDVVAAVYATQPGLFRCRRVRIVSSRRELRKGLLRTSVPSGDGPTVNLALELTDTRRFWHLVFTAWNRARKRIRPDPAGGSASGPLA